MARFDRVRALRLRQYPAAACWAAAASLALLAACETASPPPLGTVGHLQGFIGGIAADEPQAVEVARQVLSAGGSAADAAVALDFTLAVTLPSRASLSSGGVCLVYNGPQQKIEALDFVPKASAGGRGESTAPIAIPGNPRAMFALHSKYGHLLWEQLLAPSENLARNGMPVSKSLGRDLTLAAGLLAKDPEAMRVFGNANGGVIREGDKLIQADLGALIGRLRSAGPGDLYDGMLGPAVARRLAEAGQPNESSISADDLREYQPDWRETVPVSFGDDMLHFAPPPAAAGLVAAEMWLMLTADDRYKGAKDSDRDHLFAEASMRAFADRASWLGGDAENAPAAAGIANADRAKELMASYSESEHTPANTLKPEPVAMPENPAATSFVVVDREGSAVACALTMNNLFGLGRVVRGTGIVAAAAPLKGSGVSALLPMLAIGREGELKFAAAASGGAAAPAALIAAALQSLVEGRPLAPAVAAKRVLHSGAPDVLVYEMGLAEESVSALTAKKHKVFAIESLGLVNAVSCPGGLPEEPKSCAAAADPRGAGAAFASEK
jgi:gamma-glutamyltranspeptidase/glutathione hydrolase